MGGEEYFPSFQKAVYRRQRRRWLNETGQPKVRFPPFSSPRMVYKSTSEVQEIDCRR